MIDFFLWLFLTPQSSAHWADPSGVCCYLNFYFF